MEFIISRPFESKVEMGGAFGEAGSGQMDQVVNGKADESRKAVSSPMAQLLYCADGQMTLKHRWSVRGLGWQWTVSDGARGKRSISTYSVLG